MNDLKEFRERLGISQEDVASLFNVSRSYMAMMESGDRPSSGKKILLMTEAIRLLDTMEEPVLPVRTPSAEPPAFIPKELERLNARKKALEKEWKLITDKYCLLERRRMYGDRIIQSGNFPERKVSSILTKWNGLWSIDIPICDATVQKNIWDELNYIDSQIQHLTNWNDNVAE
ncbi:MAG TPA: helix-turn-helix transcriptional regulator [Catalimonadaceae bacterium]|nr:helix-turn-helix transcriptional regulator [Catalimonadaceae bacterium]